MPKTTKDGTYNVTITIKAKRLKYDPVKIFDEPTHGDDNSMKIGGSDDEITITIPVEVYTPLWYTFRTTKTKDTGDHTPIDNNCN